MSEPLDRVDHVAVVVADIRRALDWYRERFRCRVLYQDDTWAFLEFENLKMALVLPRQHPAHVTFERADAERFGPLRTHRDGTRYVYLQDPDGNTVEVMPPA